MVFQLIAKPAYATDLANGSKGDPVLVYREAGANAEQEVKIRRLAQDFEKSARVRIERIRNLSVLMRELSYEPEPDENKILNLQEEMNQLQATLNSDRIKLMLQIRKVLTGEQKQKLVQIMRETQGNKSSKPQ